MKNNFRKEISCNITKISDPNLAATLKQLSQTAFDVIDDLLVDAECLAMEKGTEQATSELGAMENIADVVEILIAAIDKATDQLPE